MIVQNKRLILLFCVLFSISQFNTFKSSGVLYNLLENQYKNSIFPQSESLI